MPGARRLWRDRRGRSDPHGRPELGCGDFLWTAGCLRLRRWHRFGAAADPPDNGDVPCAPQHPDCAKLSAVADSSRSGQPAGSVIASEYSRIRWRAPLTETDHFTFLLRHNFYTRFRVASTTLSMDFCRFFFAVERHTADKCNGRFRSLHQGYYSLFVDLMIAAA